MRYITILAAVPAIVILTVLHLILCLIMKISGIAGGLIWLALAAFGLLAFITEQWDQMIGACVITLAVYLVFFIGSFLVVLCEEIRSRLLKNIRS